MYKRQIERIAELFKTINQMKQTVTSEGAAQLRVQARQAESATQQRVQTPAYSYKPAQHTMPNFMTQDDDEQPTYNTRAKARQSRSLTQETLLAAVEVNNIKFNPVSLSGRKYPLSFLCQFANAVLNHDTGEMMEYRHLIKKPHLQKTWSTSFANEVGRLARGVGGRIMGTGTMGFISKNDVPKERLKDVTY